MAFIIGQRWVSQAEPQLGLGIIVETDGRHITAHFPAIEEDRIYATEGAPLARISYQPGDTLYDFDHRPCCVKSVEEMNGLLYYLVEDSSGEENILPEPKLSGIIQLSSPTQRFFSGQFDKNRLFQLRAATLHYRHILQKSPARGLIGPRTNLLDHQIYIAHEVANRYAPRVLLADEVGLGKTIEAGMILHHQLKTGLASRILIIVPEPLLHQWLVEMLRKFNLHFSLFDHERYSALLESGETNPFESEQLVLCGLNLLSSEPAIAAKAINANWDLTIVDEAHHLAWSSEPSKPASNEYQIVEKIAEHCKGLILLTATPEQVGIESHFARLRLLDPARFHDLERFKKEQQDFVELGNIITALANGESLNSQQLEKISSFSDIAIEENSDNDELINDLLDRHGTGRVLFRNTRAAIENFPERIPHAYPLEKPEDYNIHNGIHPEENNSDWLNQDPRVHWLEEQLTELKKDKVLLICANANTAKELEKHLHLNRGVRSTAFYEDLSIIERDRAAAYFADLENGAQVMICSEIGSEGRNFQFAHHLILFDLPTNPDLLEQRIGRLDRIGQFNDIQIHIPYIIGTAQENLYRWYQEGLNTLTSSFSAGLAVNKHFEDRLLPFIDKQAENSSDFDALISEAKTHSDAIRQELEKGRDILLELNSCRPEIADDVINTIFNEERGETLSAYLTLACENLGIENEFHSTAASILRPTEHMLISDFPMLKDEGVTITFNRNKAQSREDMEFMTWEHPLIENLFESLIGSEIGNSSIGAIKLKALPAGTFLLECFYTIQCSAPKHLQINRYLPETPVRVLLESSGKDLTNVLKHTQLNKLREHLQRSSRFAIVQQAKPVIEKLLEKSQNIAEEKSKPIIDEGRNYLKQQLNTEIQRLEKLHSLNGSVRKDELEHLQQQLSNAEKYIETTNVELQAMRLIINTAQ